MFDDFANVNFKAIIFELFIEIKRLLYTTQKFVLTSILKFNISLFK